MSLLAPRGWALREALRRLARQPAVALAAWLVCTIAVALPLAAGSLAWSLQDTWTRLNAPAQAIVFASSGTSSADITTLRERVQAQPGVSAANHVPRDAALAELTRRAGPGALPDLRGNPLPDAIVATLARGLSAEAAEATAAALRKLAKVDAVQFDAAGYRQWSGLVRAATALAATAAVALLLLAVGALTLLPRLFARTDADEARALSVAGADARFIRRPAAYAGALLGGVSAASAVGAVAAGVGWLVPRVAELGFADAVSPGLAPWPLLGAAVVFAAILGGSAGSEAARRNLRSIRP